MASKEIDKLNNPVVEKAIKKEGRFLKQLSDPDKADALMDVIISHIKTRLETLPNIKSSAVSKAKGLTGQTTIKNILKSLSDQALETARSMPGGEKVTKQTLQKFVKAGNTIPTYNVYRLLKDIPSEEKTLRRSLGELISTAPDFFQKEGLFNALLKGDLQGPELASTLKAFDAKQSGFITPKKDPNLKIQASGKVKHHQHLSSLRDVLKDVSKQWRDTFRGLAAADGYKLGDEGLTALDPAAHKMFDIIKDGKYKGWLNPKGILADLGMGPIDPRKPSKALSLLQALDEQSSHGKWARGTRGFDILGDLSNLSPEEAYKAARPILDIEKTIGLQGIKQDKILEAFKKEFHSGKFKNSDEAFETLLSRITNPKALERHRLLTEGVANLFTEAEDKAKVALMGPREKIIGAVSDISDTAVEQSGPVRRISPVVQNAIDTTKKVLNVVPTPIKKVTAKGSKYILPVAGTVISSMHRQARADEYEENPNFGNLVQKKIAQAQEGIEYVDTATGGATNVVTWIPNLAGDIVDSAIETTQDPNYERGSMRSGQWGGDVQGALDLINKMKEKELSEEEKKKNREHVDSIPNLSGFL